MEWNSITENEDFDMIPCGQGDPVYPFFNSTFDESCIIHGDYEPNVKIEEISFIATDDQFEYLTEEEAVEKLNSLCVAMKKR